ncbi:probable WRKY transcription factor 38 [Rutidosis leptorrhynchoides]|uniref:probable WRKY transcription factor 38 n=1 Tax=Rutidosis leptorrhynchoides TaxID=125765 RepID=UPI003A999676
MEYCYSNWPESSSSNHNFIQGQDLTHKFSDFFSSSNCNDFGQISKNFIHNQSAPEMYDDAFSIINNGYNIVNPVHQIPIHDMYSDNSLNCRRLNDIDRPVKPVKNKRECYNRKRSWTSTKVTRSTDDGHEWRKYGQKEILNAKHKRNYYRCIYKIDQGCQATKQVQKIEDEPATYKITYHQHHICKNLRSPQIILESSDDINDTSILLSFESNEIIENNKQVDPHHSQSVKLEEHNKGSSSLESTHNQSLSFDYSSQDITTLDPPGHENLILTWIHSPIYEIDHIFDQTDDFNEIPFDNYNYPYY